MLLAAAVCLGACATAKPPAETWTGGDLSHLAADEAACHNEADTLDVNAAANYSDPRYLDENSLQGLRRPARVGVSVVNALSDYLLLEDPLWRQGL